MVGSLLEVGVPLKQRHNVFEGGLGLASPMVWRGGLTQLASAISKSGTTNLAGQAAPGPGDSQPFLSSPGSTTPHAAVLGSWGSQQGS